MMETRSGLFQLSWEEFDTAAGNSYKELYKEQHFTNVTLACDDGKQIKAHKVILASSSAFFKRILTKNMHEQPLIYLKGFYFSELEKIVEFMYQGHTEVRQANLDRFIEAAKDLEIKGLMTQDTFVKEEKGQDNTQNDCFEVTAESSEVVPYTLMDQDSVREFQFALTDKKEDEAEEIREENVENKDLKSACNKCERIFTSRSGLWLHKKKVHEGVRHKCDLCETVFSQQTHLKRHKSKIHGISANIKSENCAENDM